MSYLDDLQAMQDLMRMNWNPDAVEGMGASGHSRFIEQLIRREEDEQHTEVRHSILHSLEQLTLPGKRPPGLLDEFAYDAKIQSLAGRLGTSAPAGVAVDRFFVKSTTVSSFRA